MALKLNSSSGGSVTLQEPTTASNYTLTVPAQTGNVVATDASGNVGIGETAPYYVFEVRKNNTKLWTDCQSSYVEQSLVGSSGTNIDWYQSTKGTGNFIWRTDGTTERMRIYANGNVGISNNLDFVGGAATVRIHLGGGTPSSSNTGIAAAWNVHSDYRLKENITPLTASLHKVSLLKPVTFSWKAEENGEITAGFLAHELAEQAPYAVFGEKDAVNEDGSIKAQAADYSKVVPLLVAAIQELKAVVDAQALKIQALENK